jgi:hypothetical protein
MHKFVDRDSEDNLVRVVITHISDSNETIIENISKEN